MAAPWVMSKLNRRASLRVVELAEHGARSTLGVLVLGHLAEENEARPLQGFCNMDGVDDVVEWCAQVHHGDVRGVLL
jgi:phage head maturation protease